MRRTRKSSDEQMPVTFTPNSTDGLMPVRANLPVLAPAARKRLKKGKRWRTFCTREFLTFVLDLLPPVKSTPKFRACVRNPDRSSFEREIAFCASHPLPSTWNLPMETTNLQTLTSKRISISVAQCTANEMEVASVPTPCN